jgi:hypothetical protein
MEIATSTSNDGEYIWEVPVDLIGSDQYQINISDVAYASIFDNSNYFEIMVPES